MAAIKTRKKKPLTDYKKHLNAVRKLTPTHILEIELDVLEDDRRHLLRKSEHLRIIHNTVLGQVYSNYRQMVRTKIFKKTMRNYIKISKQIKNGIKTKGAIREKKKLTDTFEELRNQFNVTFDFVRKYGDHLRKNNYNASDSVTTWSVCENAWDSIEGLIYRGSRKVRFYKKGAFTTLQGKQASRSIMFKSGMIRFSGMSFPLIIKKDDLFMNETLSNIETYNQNAVLINQKLVDDYLQDKPLSSTYRVRNNRIIRKEIRGVSRYFVQISLEGNPVAKRNKDGIFRHTYGVGKLGGDIGTQSIGVVGSNDVILKNFAERSKNTLKLEHKITLLQRKQERSRRAMNPDKFDAKGRFVKSSKRWIHSKRYLSRNKKLKNLHRIAAENRKYAHNEDINELRALGDEFIVETMNIKALQMKSKKATINKKTGRFNSRKRFGKSILNRSPGYFIERAKQVFGTTGGIAREVNTWTFKSSQYDHILNDTSKKSLSKRWHVLPDGSRLQRDLYSAFLLFCSDKDLKTPNRDLCIKHYDQFKKLHDSRLNKIKDNRKVVLNSGISFN